MQKFMKPENLPTVLHYLQEARQNRVGCPVDKGTLEVELAKFAELIDAIEAAEKVCSRRDNAEKATHANDAGDLYKLSDDTWYVLGGEDVNGSATLGGYTANEAGEAPPGFDDRDAYAIAPDEITRDESPELLENSPAAKYFPDVDSPAEDLALSGTAGRRAAGPTT